MTFSYMYQNKNINLLYFNDLSICFIETYEGNKKILDKQYAVPNK